MLARAACADQPSGARYALPEFTVEAAAMLARQSQSVRGGGSSLGGCHVGLEERLTRGEIWTAVGPADYAGKPRPVVIIQHEKFGSLDSVTICSFTRDTADLPLFRIAVAPSDTNGLEFTSHIMVDKILTIPKTKLGYRIGKLGERDIERLNRAIITFLGLAG
jgi:mRNA interferase MazF